MDSKSVLTAESEFVGQKNPVGQFSRNSRFRDFFREFRDFFREFRDFWYILILFFANGKGHYYDDIAKEKMKKS